MAFGSPTTMPVKMISDMPLPMPRSVICSPSHMMNAVPVVRLSMVISDEAEARIGHEALLRALQRRRDAEGLNQRQDRPSDSGSTG